MHEKSANVVKSNRLVEASYRLNLSEQRLILFAIAQSRATNQGITPETPCVFKVADFAAVFGIEDNHRNLYAQLKESTASLFKREVTITEIDPQSKKLKITQSRWISDRTYCDGLGYIHVGFAPLVIPYFNELEKEFTRYNLKDIAKLNSIYAVRLYEILKQNESIGKRDLKVAWLREHLQLDGAYPRILDFKTHVIDIAVKQINMHTDIKVGYKQLKEGRTITSFSFSIKANTEKPKTMRTKSLPVIDDEPYIKATRSPHVEAMIKGFIKDVVV